MLNAVPVVSGQAPLLIRKDRSSTLDAQTPGAQAARGQARSRGDGPLAQGLHLLSLPFLPLEAAFPWGLQEEEKGSEGGPDGGAPDHTDLGHELLGRTDTGSTGDTEPRGEDRVSLVLAGPVLLGSTLYSHLFWKVCEAQGREMLPQHRRHGRKLYFANLTWAFVSCPPSPSAILPSRRHTRPVAPHTGRPGEAGACAFAPGQCKGDGA